MTTVNKVLLSIAALIVALVVLFFATTDFTVLSKEQKEAAGKGLEALGGEFTLQSAQEPKSLSDFAGKAVVLYFGFLHCPDYCPAAMVTAQSAIEKLSAEQAEDVQVIFVSVDPDRDTPAKVDEYVKYFNPKFIGMTDTKESIDKVVKQYGAYYKVDTNTSAENGFGVQHTTRYYVINKAGKIAAAMRASTTPNELAAQLIKLL